MLILRPLFFSCRVRVIIIMCCYVCRFRFRVLCRVVFCVFFVILLFLLRVSFSFSCRCRFLFSFHVTFHVRFRWLWLGLFVIFVFFFVSVSFLFSFCMCSVRFICVGWSRVCTVACCYSCSLSCALRSCVVFYVSCVFGYICIYVFLCIWYVSVFRVLVVVLYSSVSVYVSGSLSFYFSFRGMWVCVLF